MIRTTILRSLMAGSIGILTASAHAQSADVAFTGSWADTSAVGQPRAETLAVEGKKTAYAGKAPSRVAFPTDSPAAGYSSCKLLDSINAAVAYETFGGQDAREVVSPESEHMTLDQALQAAAINSTIGMRTENRIEWVQAGKLPDLVTLEKCLFAIEPREVHRTSTLPTTMTGQITQRVGI